MTQILTARQAQRMLHFVRRARFILQDRIDHSTAGAVLDSHERRELAAVEALIAEVEPIVYPVTPAPPGMRNARGNVD